MECFFRVEHKKKALWCKLIDNEYYELEGSIYANKARISKRPLKSRDFRFLPPCDGQKVIGLAYNYKGLVGKKKHYDEPLFFFKSPTGLLGHKGKIVYPDFSHTLWIEAELAIIIGKKGKNVSEREADKYILGYTCANDVTCLNVLGRDWHLARSKGIDTFAPLGPCLVKGLDTADLKISSYINDKISQDSRTSDRVLNDRQTVSLISRFVTLFPGDVIMTGTPAGAREAIVTRNDIIKIVIEGIGSLINYVS